MAFSSISALLVASWWTLSLQLVWGTPVTVVIDDTYGDTLTGVVPVYSPAANWTQGKHCLPDDGCLVNPDPARAMNGTWHDSVGKSADSPPRTVDLVFQGTEIHIYCILADIDYGEIAVTNLTFEIDGHEVGSEFRNSPGGDGMHYNAEVYSNVSIPSGNHTLRISSVGYSRLLFDYATYKTDTDLLADTVDTITAPSPKMDLPLIIGASVAGAVGFVLFSILGLWAYRRRRQRRPEPYPIDHIQAWRAPGKSRDDVSSIRLEANKDSMAMEQIMTYAYAHSDGSHTSYHDGASVSVSAENSPDQLSPSDSAPLIRPARRSTVPTPRQRLVVSSASAGGGAVETRLIGPDNAMARAARAEVAKREAELARQLRAVEARIAAEMREAQAQARTDPGRRDGPGTATEAERAMREQLEALREEMQQLRTRQQEMALQLLEATEPLPEYR